MALALISVAVGAFGGLVQKNLKRLWAYSSIANVGYAVLGLAAGTSEGVQGMLVFMILYMIDVTGFFACLAALSRSGRAMETMEDMAGLRREQPGLALAMTVFSLSALGLPPFSGFGPRCSSSRPPSTPASAGRRWPAWWAPWWPPSTTCG